MIGRKIKTLKVKNDYSKNYYQAWSAFKKQNLKHSISAFRHLIDIQIKKFDHIERTKPHDYGDRLAELAAQLRDCLAYYLAADLLLSQTDTDELNQSTIRRMLNKQFNSRIFTYLSLPFAKNSWQHSLQLAEILVISIVAKDNHLSVNFQKLNLIAKAPLQAFETEYCQDQLALIEKTYPDIRLMPVKYRREASRFAYQLAQIDRYNDAWFYKYYKKYLVYKMCSSFKSLAILKQKISDTKSFIKKHCPAGINLDKEQGKLELATLDIYDQQQHDFQTQMEIKLAIVDYLGDVGHYSPRQYTVLRKWLQFSTDFHGQYLPKVGRDSKTKNVLFFLKANIGRLSHVSFQDKTLNNYSEVKTVTQMIEDTKKFIGALDNKKVITDHPSKDLQASLTLYYRNLIDEPTAIQHLGDFIERESRRLTINIESQLAYNYIENI